MIFTKSLLSAAVAILQLASASSSGIVNRANSAAAAIYTVDGRTCCTDGEHGASFTGDTCEYESDDLITDVAKLDLHVTKCCWNDEKNQFHVHLADNHEVHHVSPMNFTGNTTIPLPICNLGLHWNITEFILTDDYLDINAELGIDCGSFQGSDREWARLYFDSAYRDVGKYTYTFSHVNGDIVASIYSKIRTSDSSVDFHVELTGTGLLSVVKQEFDKNIRVDEVAQILSQAKICS